MEIVLSIIAIVIFLAMILTNVAASAGAAVNESGEGRAGEG